MIIESSAPTRVDIAGGTVDIWPLYLFHRNAVTVNFAIDLPARCRITSRTDGKYLLRSVDTVESLELSNLDELWSSPKLRLLCKLIHFFAPGSGLEMETHSTAPAGSGLAGSSALNIAICGALNHLTGAGYTLPALIDIARDVEAQVIDVPTGVQDYYPAAYGGIQAIHLNAGSIRREPLATDVEKLSERMILIYSGRQRNSGVNNWNMMKRHIDKDAEIFHAFEGIVQAAIEVLEALRQNRFDRLDQALELEWSNRKILSSGIKTPEMEAIVEQARSFGARATKVCGAGGGGCFLMTVPAGRRGEIQDKLKRSGVHVLDYRIANEGLQLQVMMQ
jgi:D-glycero-alpha-D-manno-heptose-7-phosphate kinase